MRLTCTAPTSFVVVSGALWRYSPQSLQQLRRGGDQVSVGVLLFLRNSPNRIGDCRVSGAVRDKWLRVRARFGNVPRSGCVFHGSYRSNRVFLGVWRGREGASEAVRGSGQRVRQKHPHTGRI